MDNDRIDRATLTTTIERILRTHDATKTDTKTWICTCSRCGAVIEPGGTPAHQASLIADAIAARFESVSSVHAGGDAS